MSSKINLSVGERIAYFRKQKGMSQDDLAKKLNKSRPTIAAYEADKIHLTNYQLLEIADILKIVIDDLTPDATLKNSAEEQKHSYSSSNEDQTIRMMQLEAEIKALKRELTDKQLLIEEKNKTIELYDEHMKYLKAELTDSKAQFAEYKKLYEAILKKLS